MSDRAAAPVLGAVLLVALAVVTAAGVGALVVVQPPTATPSAAFTLSATPDGTVSVTHRGGDPVSPDRLRLWVRVDGRRLTHQPPVPFFAAEGFRSGPTGPFNRAFEGPWTAGTTASLRVASTNSPPVTAGATVRIRLYADGQRLAVLETTA